MGLFFFFSHFYFVLIRVKVFDLRFVQGLANIAENKEKDPIKSKVYIMGRRYV